MSITNYEQRRIIGDARAGHPAAVAAAAERRQRRPWLGPSGRLMIIAADHTARGRANDLSPDAVIRSVAIASALGTTSAYTWLKIPVVAEMERVAEAFTLPALLLGGEIGDRPDEMFESWRKALALPNMRGLVVGRNLLYPPGDDVAAAVDIAVGLL